MAGWGLDKEQLGGSRLLPAYPPRLTLAEARRILAAGQPRSGEGGMRVLPWIPSTTNASSST
jgi:hypothetical protein